MFDDSFKSSPKRASDSNVLESASSWSTPPPTKRTLFEEHKIEQGEVLGWEGAAGREGGGGVELQGCLAPNVVSNNIRHKYPNYSIDTDTRLRLVSDVPLHVN